VLSERKISRDGQGAQDEIQPKGAEAQLDTSGGTLANHLVRLQDVQIMSNFMGVSAIALGKAISFWMVVRAVGPLLFLHWGLAGRPGNDS
jgi:hypothetical protein